MNDHSEGRADAVEQLDAARGRQQRCGQEYDASRGSTEELGASVALVEAHEQMAAREAWLAWIDRDY